MPQLDLFASPSPSLAPLVEMPTSSVATGERVRKPDSAEFSPDGVYRFLLERDLGGDRPIVFVGCNPSVANAKKNDPTITKEVGFTTRWGGFGRLIKVNPYAFVATDPKVMKAARKAGHDVVGPSNDDYIRRALGQVLLGNGVLVLGCGNDVAPARMLEIERIVRFSGVTPLCLGRNGKDKRGMPKHPLYLSYATPLVPYELGVLAA